MRVFASSRCRTSTIPRSTGSSEIGMTKLSGTPQNVRATSRACAKLSRTPRRFASLPRNPLLLTMMAILSRNQDLPRDRNKLYEKCAELLLKNWDLEKFPELKEKKESAGY